MIKPGDRVLFLDGVPYSLAGDRGIVFELFSLSNHILLFFFFFVGVGIAVKDKARQKQVIKLKLHHTKSVILPHFTPFRGKILIFLVSPMVQSKEQNFSDI